MKKNRPELLPSSHSDVKITFYLHLGHIRQEFFLSDLLDCDEEGLKSMPMKDIEKQVELAFDRWIESRLGFTFGEIRQDGHLVFGPSFKISLSR